MCLDDDRYDPVTLAQHVIQSDPIDMGRYVNEGSESYLNVAKCRRELGVFR